MVSDLFAHSQYICRSVFFVFNLFALRKMPSLENIDKLLKALEAKYLLAEGLMVSIPQVRRTKVTVQRTNAEMFAAGIG